MKLDYFTLLCPEPISLSIGTLKHPTLREIGKITHQQFSFYQLYLKITPDEYFRELKKSKLEEWESIPEETRSKMTMFDLLLNDLELAEGYEEIFNFFFIERVIFREQAYFLVTTDDYKTPDNEFDINEFNVKGVITEKTFLQVLDVIQQICCIKSDDAMDEPLPKFKNEKARKLYERMKAAQDQRKKEADLRNAPNYSLANVISAVASKSKNLNIFDIWDITLFQLYDQFGKLRNDDYHYINEVRVAVWGDEKKQFDDSLWYKNNFDKS